MMFYADAEITSIQLSELKQMHEEMEDCPVEELILCAYIDRLPLCCYLKATIENEYGEIL